MYIILPWNKQYPHYKYSFPTPGPWTTLYVWFSGPVWHQNQTLKEQEIKETELTLSSHWETPFFMHIQIVVIWNSWEAWSVWRQRPFSYHRNEIPLVLEVKVSAPVSLFCDCDKVLNIRGWQMWFRPPTAAGTGPAECGRVKKNVVRSRHQIPASSDSAICTRDVNGTSRKFTAPGESLWPT